VVAGTAAVLWQAQGRTPMGMRQTAQPWWVSAASLEERIAPLLDADGEALEAAVHRISAASCYEKAGDLSRAVNLYQAALAGPLLDDTRQDVQKVRAECLAELARSTSPRPTQ